MSVFSDVEVFMKAANHTPDLKRVGLYFDLVREEVGELEQAMAAHHAAENKQDEQIAKADALDAICDSIWVLIGLGKVMDLPLEWGWDLVALSNARKIDPELGKILRDESGKIMKPLGWKPPDMLRIIKEHELSKQQLDRAESGE